MLLTCKSLPPDFNFHWKNIFATHIGIGFAVRYINGTLGLVAFKLIGQFHTQMVVEDEPVFYIQFCKAYALLIESWSWCNFHRFILSIINLQKGAAVMLGSWVHFNHLAFTLLTTAPYELVKWWDGAAINRPIEDAISSVYFYWLTSN